VSKAFLGADAVHIASGFMTTDESTAKMNEIVIRNASRSFVLADSEKFTRDSFARYAALAQVETIFTDNGVDQDVLQGFRDAGARVVVVPGRAPAPGRASD
jgi:DeoR/GlpR family transcriptional regulator of sugar metabolism